MEKLPFIPQHIYNRRRDIHSVYGGNWQGGICPSAQYPYIFIFSGQAGQQHGYQDGWDNPNVFCYSGEGQAGNMEFTRGNLALRDHIHTGKRVFLFESHSRGYVRFICELESIDFDYIETTDTAGNNRIGIKFFFKRKGVEVPAVTGLKLSPLTVKEPETTYGNLYPNITERQGLVTSRVGQGAYQKRIIHRWEYKCAVTGFNRLEVLVASHILPWAMADHNQRLDVHNGILLSPTYDALFDRHLISFENSGKILLSEKIEPQAFKKIGVTGHEQIKNLSSGNFDYLDRHRKVFCPGP